MNRTTSHDLLSLQRWVQTLCGAFLLAVLSVWTGRAAYGQAPDWQVDPAPFEATMSMTARLVIDGKPSSDPNDRVAAFVDGELRGVAAPMPVGDKMLFFLTIYANQSGEEVTFQAYQADAESVRDVRETVSFATNAVVGSPAEPFVWRVGEGVSETFPAPADWAVDPAAFEYSMNLTADLPGLDDLDEQDRLAAFVGTEVRGLETSTLVGGRMVFFLTLYANQQDETVTFRLYDASRDAVRELRETVDFSINGVVGSPAAPLALSVVAGVLPSVPMLTVPAEMADGVALSPVLDWAAVADAERYTVEVSTSASFTQSTLRTGITDTEVQMVGLAPLTVHYWRVQAENAAGTGPWSAVRQFTTGTPTAVEDDATPGRFQLAQNYPNPFNPVTTIRFMLEEPTPVWLEVYDVHGRCLDVLVAGRHLGPGSHAITVDAGTWPSGVYLYRLTAGEHRQVRAMTLMK